jgi:hypothetical protein
MNFVNPIFSFYQGSVQEEGAEAAKETSGRPTEVLEENELKVRKRTVACR